MSKLYLGDTLISSLEASDINYDTDNSVKDKIDSLVSGKLDSNANAVSATKLATARTIRTNLASTSTASFDGSGNVTPGVTGTLPIANGGTGATTAASALTKLGLTATATELNYMDGVTSKVQTQINNVKSSLGTQCTFSLSGTTLTITPK